MASPIIVYQGDSKRITATVRYKDTKVDFPLAGYACKFIVKTIGVTPVTVIEKIAAAGDITSNIVVFNLTPTDTDIASKEYVYVITITREDLSFFKTAIQDALLILNN